MSVGLGAWRWLSSSDRCRGGHHRSYLADAGSHTHRFLCKLCLGWGSCWLVHREQSITLLQHRRWCWSKWSMCGVSSSGARVDVILDKGVAEEDSVGPHGACAQSLLTMQAVQGLGLIAGGCTAWRWQPWG